MRLHKGARTLVYRNFTEVTITVVLMTLLVETINITVNFGLFKHDNEISNASLYSARHSMAAREHTLFANTAAVHVNCSES